MTNRKLKIASRYYAMASRMRAMGNKLEAEGWAEKREAYVAYIASLDPQAGFFLGKELLGVVAQPEACSA